MRQVLFTIPIFGGIKIFGYGVMLVFAFFGSTGLAAWRARREKLDPELFYDMAVWVYLGGLVGARLFYVIQYLGRPGPVDRRRLPGLGGGDRPLREHHRRDARVLPLPARTAVPDPAVPRRDRPGSGAGDRTRATGLFHERLLLRRPVRPPLGRELPQGITAVAPTGPRRPDRQTQRLTPLGRLLRSPPPSDRASLGVVAAAAPDAALFGDRRAGPAGPALGLFPAPPP